MTFDVFLNSFNDDVEISLLKEFDGGLISFNEDEVLECKDLKEKDVKIKNFKVVKINGLDSNVINILVS